jgi:hypothetical protein
MLEKEARVSSNEGKPSKDQNGQRRYEEEEVQDASASQTLEEPRP